MNGEDFWTRLEKSEIENAFKSPSCSDKLNVFQDLSAMFKDFLGIKKVPCKSVTVHFLHPMSNETKQYVHSRGYALEETLEPIHPRRSRSYDEEDEGVNPNFWKYRIYPK